MIDEDGYFDAPAQADALALEKVKADARERDRQDAFGAVIESPSGRQFLWHLLEKCGVWSSSYGPDADFREGQRNIGIRVLQEMDSLRPGLLFLMSEENQGREFRYARLQPPQVDEE